jgi:hypothetical protein
VNPEVLVLGLSLTLSQAVEPVAGVASPRKLKLPKVEVRLKVPPKMRPRVNRPPKRNAGNGTQRRPNGSQMKTAVWRMRMARAVVLENLQTVALD